jgi:hypothetical protein
MEATVSKAEYDAAIAKKKTGKSMPSSTSWTSSGD